MRLRLAFPLLLLTTALVAAEPADKDSPPTPEAKALDKLLDLIRNGDAKAAQPAYEKLVKDFPGKDAADEATWHYACFLYRDAHLDKAQELLLPMKRSGRENRWTSLAVLGLAEVAQKRGDERAMVGYLEEAIKAPATPTARNIMDTLDTQQEAILRLARHYRAKGDFKKALDYFTRWEPRSWCGTCRMQMRADRERAITLCRQQLGEHAAVARESLRGLVKNDWLGDLNAWLLWRTYADADQLGDLRGMLNAYEKSWAERPRTDVDARMPTQSLRDLLRVHDLADKKDVAALIALCQEKGPRNYVVASQGGEQDFLRSIAAEALAGLGGIEVEPIKAALAKGGKEPGWLLYSLGRSGSLPALAVLTEFAERTRGDDAILAENIAYALALHGEPGGKVLKRLARPSSALGREAGEWSDRTAEPAWPAVTWPRPKAGSLPKTLTEVR